MRNEGEVAKQNSHDEECLLALRLVVASGRIEMSVYQHPISLADAAFRLLLAEALMTLADNVFSETNVIPKNTIE